MRTSSPQYTEEETIQAIIDSGKEIVVRDWAGSNDIQIRSLKRINRTAYDTHLCEVEINGVRARVNIEDLKSALRYV
jgi:hypothetical protein